MYKNRVIQDMQVVKYKQLTIDYRYCIVKLSGKEIQLCPKEVCTLQFLAKYPGWVFTKNQIYKEVYGDIAPINVDNIIYCLIYGLRKKLKEDSSQFKCIQTVRGIGYKFVVPER